MLRIYFLRTQLLYIDTLKNHAYQLQFPFYHYFQTVIKLLNLGENKVF